MADSILTKLSEIEVTGLTIYGEARGESVMGQIAVGCVIRNRVITETYQQVCLKPKQFSCWNENDPNYPILIELASKLVWNEVDNNEILDQCLFIAGGIVNDHLIDITNGAKNYLTEHLFHDSKRPSWAAHPTNVQAIDSQVFFNV